MRSSDRAGVAANGSVRRSITTAIADQREHGAAARGLQCQAGQASAEEVTHHHGVEALDASQRRLHGVHGAELLALERGAELGEAQLHRRLGGGHRWSVLEQLLLCQSPAERILGQCLAADLWIY